MVAIVLVVDICVVAVAVVADAVSHQNMLRYDIILSHKMIDIKVLCVVQVQLSKHQHA